MRSVKVRVPGKILLAGEYAVLDGHPALSLAVDRFLEVTLSETAAGGWQLASDLWLEPRLLDEASIHERASEPLLQVSEFAQHHFALPHMHIQIQSQLDIRHGLGSSTALRLGVLLGAAALAQDQKNLHPSFLLEAAALAYRMQLVQQSFASGYDVLTQALGGLLLWTPDYQNWPGSSLRSLDPAPLAQHLQILVGGRGAPTAKVGGSVRQALSDSGQQRAYYEASDQIITSWLKVLQLGDSALPQLCHDIAGQRRIFAALPFFPSHLFEKLDKLPGFDQNWTLKTTGAGGEDALLLIGRPEQTEEALLQLAQEGWQPLPVRPAIAGARIIS